MSSSFPSAFTSAQEAISEADGPALSVKINNNNHNNRSRNVNPNDNQNANNHRGGQRGGRGTSGGGSGSGRGNGRGGRGRGGAVTVNHNYNNDYASPPNFSLTSLSKSNITLSPSPSINSSSLSSSTSPSVPTTMTLSPQSNPHNNDDLKEKDYDVKSANTPISSSSIAPSSSSSSLVPSVSSPLSDNYINDQNDTDEKKSISSDFSIDDDSPYPPPISHYIHYINSLYEDNHITLQQTSLLRMAIIRQDKDITPIISHYSSHSKLNPSSPLPLSPLLTSLTPLLSSLLAIESRCITLQSEELSVLRSIFSSEFHIYHTYPFTLSLLCQQQSLDCAIELYFLFPSCYPIKEGPMISAYVPPPFNTLITDDFSVLLSELKDKSMQYIGEESTGCVYDIVSHVTEWMNEKGQMLKSTLEKQQEERRGKGMRVLNTEEYKISENVNYGGGESKGKEMKETKVVEKKAPQQRITPSTHSTRNNTPSPSTSPSPSSPLHGVFTRGQVEKLLRNQLFSLSEEFSTSIGIVLSVMRESLWDKEKAREKLSALVKKRKEMVAKGEKTFFISEPNSLFPFVPSPTPSVGAPIPLKRQSSLIISHTVDLLLSSFPPFSSPSVSTPYSCLTCMEDFEAREGILHLCDHFQCLPCYRLYIQSNMSTGYVKCCGHKCSVLVEEGVICTLLPTYDFQRIRRWLQDSYIQMNLWEFCPNSLCQNVFASNSASHMVCYCGQSVCSHCKSSPHWPVSCAVRDDYFSNDLIMKLRKSQSEWMKLEFEKQKKGNVQSIATKKCPKW